MKTFTLQTIVASDSSIAQVAEGMEFKSGQCAVSFGNQIFTYRSVDDLIKAFCADGRTFLEYK
jgi:hypothetical protein